MGLKRFLVHTFIPFSRHIDTAKNIVDKRGIADGVKKTIKDEYTEDNPFTRVIYKSGKVDGKKEGYFKASDEYEQKLLEQADEFLKQTKIYEGERDAYEKLLDAYESEIDKLTEKANKTEDEKEYLQQLLIKDHKLRKMS